MMQRNEIENCANDILNKFKISDAPYLHIKEICTHEEIKIKRTNFGVGMDGAFSVINGEKVIFYNASKTLGRSNFTKSHELGHYFLNHKLESGNAIYCLNKGICEGNQQSLPRIETEANYFASYFLMPKMQLFSAYINIADKILNRSIHRPLYVDRQPCNIKDWEIVSYMLTAQFGVSKEALRYRMETLNILNYNL